MAKFRSVRGFYRSLQPWIIWGLGASFFFSEYFARVDPSIIAASLMRDFSVGAFAIGTMSAYFYYPYILMQIPVGSLLDRFGVHRLMTCAALLTGFGAILFSYAPNLVVAEYARAVMGFSAAFAFVGTLKLASVWFEPRRLGLLSGLTQGMGMLGAATGVGVFAFVVGHLGWRDTIFMIGIILIVIGILIGLFVRDKRPTLLGFHTKPEVTQLSILEGLKIVFRNPYSWINATYSGLVYAPTAAFAELWGPSFMHRNFGMPHDIASLAVSVVFIGWAIGGPLAGWVSDTMRRRRPLMFVSAFLSLVLILALLFFPIHMPGAYIYLFIILFLYGIANTGVALSYAVASEINPLPAAGLSVALANMMSIAIGALLQPVIGWLLVLSWKGRHLEGIPFYSGADYRHAMMILPVSLVLACILVFFIKETHCQRR